MEKKIIYQVLPRLWKKGKFSDWNKESFDYVKSLGVDCIWYTGIVRHASGEDWVKGETGSPYAISDWFDVNPYLADNQICRIDEFKSLVNRTHDAGLKVVIDYIPNHVARCGANSIPTYGYCDYDWTDTVKVNYEPRETWDKMLEIVKYWAGMGVDGMRCDMVELVPRDFLKWLITEVRKAYPDFFFIAEVYNRQNYSDYLNYVGFDLLYDKSGLYDSLRAVLCSGMTARCLTWNWQSLGDLQTGMLNFLENHDEQRIASGSFAGDPGRSYAALAVSALFNKASFMLYFGQECGESAPESDNGRTSIFSNTVVKSLEHPSKKVLNRYREVLKLASSSLCRNGANWDLCYCNESSPGFNVSKHFAFLRFEGRQALLVVCNFSDTPAHLGIHIPEECGFGPGDIEIDVPAWDFALSSL